MCSIQKWRVNHHGNYNSIIYRKVAIDRAEIESPLLAAKGFNANLVQFLMSFLVIISNTHICFFNCTIYHLLKLVRTGQSLYVSIVSIVFGLMSKLENISILSSVRFYLSSSCKHYHTISRLVVLGNSFIRMT